VSDDTIVLDVDPDPEKPLKPRPVVARLDGVPPRAKSNGWGEIPGRP
jgi:hypothetical protein